MPGHLHGRLRQRLLGLSYRAFLQCVIRLLNAQGYHAVAPVGRNRFKGRNQRGGWDLEARYAVRDVERSGAVRSAACIAQVKQFDALTVAQRQVDELRGCLVRAGADTALLITLSAFSPVAQEAAKAGQEQAPIRLIAGEELLDLLIQYQIGVRRSGREWIVDDGYFESLEQRFSQSQERQESSHRGERLASRTVAAPCPRRRETESKQYAVPPTGTRPPGTLPCPGSGLILQGGPVLRLTITVTRFGGISPDQNDFHA